MPVKPRLLLIGFGQLNQRVAQQLASEFTITAVSKSHKQANSVTHLSLNLTRDDFSVLAETDFIVYCLSPSSYDQLSYRQIFVDCLRKILDHYDECPPKRLFFVSSTSVYGQNNDEEVNEDSIAKPSGFNGRILVEAEQCLRQSTIPSTVIRFSGIYGHSRTGLLSQIELGKRSSSPPSGYTNRISEDDAVGILCHLLRIASKGKPVASCYLASDDLPVRLHEVVAWVRKQLACLPEVDKNPKQRAGSKRCSNQRIKDSGYTFQHPSYQEGYAEIIAARGKY